MWMDVDGKYGSGKSQRFLGTFTHTYDQNRYNRRDCKYERFICFSLRFVKAVAQLRFLFNNSVFTRIFLNSFPNVQQIVTVEYSSVCFRHNNEQVKNTDVLEWSSNQF